jgi:drug/metabolite transporter (DMT)-like permease
VSAYLIGIIFSLIAICFHAWANIFDHYFSTKIFDKLSVLIFFSGFINLFFLPFIFIIDKPDILSLSSYGIITLISLINVFYHYPYYWALRATDTSIVTSLFSLGKIFTPLFAFIIVNEHLTNIQYSGFFIIIIASVFLTLDFKKFRLNREFILMLIVSILLTVQVVLYKFLFEKSVKWGSSIFSVVIVDFIIVSVIILIPENFKALKSSAKMQWKQRGLLVLNQFFTWGGDVAGLAAIYLIPVSLFEGIESTQPMIVLIFAILFAKKFPHLFNEYLGQEGIKKKIMLFILMILGTILIIF